MSKYGSASARPAAPASASAVRAPVQSQRAPQPPAPSVDDLPDEVSEPFFKGLGVVYVDVDDPTGRAKCDLCSFAKKHPPPPYDDPAAHPAEAERRWGVLHDCLDDVTLCKQDEEEQHAFHAGCLRAFILANKAKFRQSPGCPVCDSTLADLTKKAKPAAAAGASAAAGGEEKKGDDDDLFGDDEAGVDEVGQTGGKKRKRDKQMYSVWVHVRQATGLALVASDKTMNPVAYVSVFGKTVQTARGDGGKTYNCVWNEAFSFSKLMDEDEFSREVIQIRVEDHAKLLRNTLIGFVKFQAETVHAQPNHEFYQLQYPIVNMAKKKSANAGGITMQGQLEVSVCVLSEQDTKDDPTLPRHIYDAEVEMWAELQNKAEVVDFDVNKNYLQNNLNLKKEQDAARKLTMFDIVHVRVYRAEDLPKLDWQGWVDAFIELEYKGLMDKNAKLKSKPVLKNANPTWNMEFTLPLVHGAPLVYNRFELVVKNHNTLGSDDWIGKCAINLSDVLALPPNSPPMWKSLYQDIDGRAPTYRGRVLIELSVEHAQPDAKLYTLPCSPVSEELIPASGSYRLDVEVLEGMHLLEDYSDYQVDITLGHSMTVGDKGSHPCSEETQKEREKGGKAWATVESDTARVKGANKTVIPFLTKKSLMVHNMPYPRRVDAAQPPTAADLAVSEQKMDAKLDSLPASAPLSPTGNTKLRVPPGGGLGYTGDAAALSFHSVREDFNNCTTLLDYKAMMPDLIIYISKKGGESGRKNCVGYIRIPLNGLKRPTENWEHGEDLTVFPHLWEPEEACARALPLKPLVELYQLTSGFLLFKATLTPVQGKAVSSAAAQHATTRLEPVPRQRYKFVANVYQAKDMASVDSSGLSSPFVTVQIGDAVALSKHKPLTCNPLWFEALSGEVDLPVNLLHAPDFAITAYHKGESLFKFNDPKTFMGRADVPAHVASQTRDTSQPAWYPLQFEEHQYGHILLSFRLTPLKDLASGVDLVQSGIEQLVSGWENYAVEVSALDLRGKIAAKHKMKKLDPTYQIECWNDVQNYVASSIRGDKFTVYLRKPANPVFYSSVNFRLYEGKELSAVCSIPIGKILRSGMSWYKLLELILREERMTQKRVVRKWRAFLAKKKFVDPRSIRRTPRPELWSVPASPSNARPGAAPGRVVDEALQSGDGRLGDERDFREDEESGDEDVAPSTDAATRFKYRPDPLQVSPLPASPSGANRQPSDERTSLRDAAAAQAVYSPGDVTIDVNEVASLAAGAASPNDEALLAAASKPRNQDADGNEVFEEKDLRYLQCESLPDKDAGNPFETHWRLECEYEMLPLVNDPFLDVELWVGKDEIHSTFLEKLFSRGKHSVGRLRGHFFGYQIGSRPGAGSALVSQGAAVSRVNPLFDAEKYFNPLEYCVRVYILRGLQLSCGKGKASGCDPFVSVSMAGGEAQKSAVLDGTLNPQFYQCFDFQRVPFPALESSLTISVFNDNTLFSADLVGETEIHLENRLFSKPWNAAQKPIERRALKRSKTGRLPQGFIETVVEIIPMHLIGTRVLDYLLNPPKRMPWELRVILWNAKNVTLKKIYKDGSEGCCGGCCDCCVDICSPPNQSDIKLIAGMSGSKQPPQATDTHPRSIDGTGNFNWRCVFDVELPSPKMLSNLKLQVWNINWNPDDCLAEAVIPLWGFFELARRQYEKDPSCADGRVARIPRQWVKLTHPQNSDVGDVEVEVELLPKDVAATSEYKAAAGEEGFKEQKNSRSHTLSPPNRPDDSFPWYRLDLQLIWRCKYAWRKIRWYVFGAMVLFIAFVVAIAYLKAKMYL